MAEAVGFEPTELLDAWKLRQLGSIISRVL